MLAKVSLDKLFLSHKYKQDFDYFQNSSKLVIIDEWKNVMIIQKVWNVHVYEF